MSTWLDNAKSKIGITANQQQAWSDYADAVVSDREAMQAMHTQMPSLMRPDVSAPDRLQARLGFMSARLQSLENIQAATKRLFDVLTPDQRSRADNVLWAGC